MRKGSCGSLLRRGSANRTVQSAEQRRSSLAAEIRKGSIANRKASIAELEKFITQGTAFNLRRTALAILNSPAVWYRGFCQRGMIFHHSGNLVYLWEWVLLFLTLYTTAYLPLQLVFEEVRFRQYWLLDSLIDGLFLFDCLLVKLRTSYRDHGYDVNAPRLIAKR